MELLSGKLLSYGVSGFALILIGLTYMLMQAELKRRTPRSSALKTIWIFMGLVLASTLMVGFFSLPTLKENTQLHQKLDDLKVENNYLEHKIDTLTIDIAMLLNLVQNYEIVLTEISDRIGPPPLDTTDPKPADTGVVPGGGVKPGIFLPGLLKHKKVLQHVNASKLKTYQDVSLNLNDSAKKAIIKESKIALGTSQLHLIQKKD